MERNNVYLNDFQRKTYYIGAHTTIVAGGRRLGKSRGLHAPWMLRNMQYMPMSSGGIVCQSYQKLLTQVLPGTLEGLSALGYKEGIHYVIGIKPPESFAKPFNPPKRYDRVISFYNGSNAYLISQDITGSSNSLTLQWIAGDEAKHLDFEKLKDETFPANGGLHVQWKGCPWLNSILFTSDIPTSKKGSWFLNYREKMDDRVIIRIEDTLAKISELSKKPLTPHRERVMRALQIELEQMQSIAVYYAEVSTIENFEVVGKKYLAQMKRDLTPLVFHTSILGRRIEKIQGNFYENLSQQHYYTAYDNAILENCGYDFERARKLKCLQDGDLDRKKPICVAFDYNANINWLVAGQSDGMKMKVLKSFYVKYERKLRELVDDFCDYYAAHGTREVIYYYDQTALGSNYAVNSDSFASVIINQFRINKWKVKPVSIGGAPKHSEKHLMINQALLGQKYLYPQFNEDHNEALIPAMEHTGIKIGRGGFEKDKSGEKLGETEEDPLELRTDGTDAFDTLFIGMNKFPQRTSSGRGTASAFIG